MGFVLRLLAGLFLTLWALPFAAAQMSSPASPAGQNLPSWAAGDAISQTRLLADVTAVAPGDEFHLGIHQILPDGWHTYWRNAGDAGLPIELKWQVPDGLEIGDIVWPAPKALPIGPIMDYGYSGEVTLPLPVRLSPDYEGDRVDIRVKASWLVCEEICIPEEGEYELVLPVAQSRTEHPDDVWYIRAALDAVPPLAEGLDASIAIARGRMVLWLSGDFLADPSVEWRNLTFFPFDPYVMRHAAPQSVDTSDGVTRLITEPGPELEHGLARSLGGILKYEVLRGGSWVPAAVEILAHPGEANISDLALPSSGELPGNLPLLLILALGGGLILNLMPCVFPVLSIKLLHVIGSAHDHPGQIRTHGMLFFAGVLISFVLLAALLVALREFGLPLGWGFQLQVPVVVALLALLFFAIGLNLLGSFETGTSLQGAGSSLADRPGPQGAFFTGVLAVVVAAPCVGPLAAGALGAALTQPAPVVLLVAAAMGAGLALPFLLLSLFPALLKFVPKPGAWMETFKQALAFPMFASALWLVWVLSQQSGPAGLLLIGTAFLVFALWVWGRRQSGPVFAVIAWLALIGSVLAAGWVSRLPAVSSTQTLSAGEEPWSRERVAMLRASQRPVFIDVTAAWCVTCQLNKMRVLQDPDVLEAFETFSVARLKADWTNRDDDIAELIYQHGAAGVPLYLLYPASGGPAIVLPTVLNEDDLIAAIAAAG